MSDLDERPVPILDALYPYAGPCWVCGFGDKRHRLADAVVGGVLAGDTVEMTAENYEVPEEAIRTLLAYAIESKRRHRARWEIRG